MTPVQKIVDNHPLKTFNGLTLAIENAINAFMTSKYNPFYYHGALPQYYLWVL
jgi:hypothetical protein